MANSGEFRVEINTVNQVTAYVTVKWSEPDADIDIENNQSKVVANLYATVRSSYWDYPQRTFADAKVTVDGKSDHWNPGQTPYQYTEPGTYHDYYVGTVDKVIKHNDDGTKSIVISISGTVKGGTSNSTSKTIALTPIPRGTQPVISPQIIDKPTQNLSITATRKYSTYKHTIKWCVIPNGSIDSPDPPANQWTTLVTEGTTESFTVNYTDLKAKLDAAGAYVGIIRVNAITYDENGNIVGSATGNYANSKIKTGMVPLALYDDLGGGVGVTLTGSPSGREGIFVDDKGPFEITQVTLNIGGQSKTGYILFCEG